MSRLTPHQIAVYAQAYFDDRWEWNLRLNHFVFGQFAAYAFHDPKKYPKDIEKYLEKPEDRNKPMSPEKMAKMLKSLAGDYGDQKPKVEKK